MPPCPLRLFLPLTPVLLAASGPLSAADFANTSLTGGDWFNPANWSDGKVPGVGETSARILNGGTAFLRAGEGNPASLSLSSLSLGRDSSSTAPPPSGGTLEIDGAITLGATLFYIGTQADSALRVTGGASLKATNGRLNIGGATTVANGRGMVEIGGTGTTAEVRQLDFASGALDIFGGARFVVTNSNGETTPVIIGRHTESAEAILTLDNATWESNGGIRVGHVGSSGKFILKNNATATLAGDRFTDITIGQDGGAGELAVTSGSTLESTGTVRLGRVVDKPGTRSSGSAIVSGAASQWTHHGEIRLDFTNALTVSSGGVLRQDSGGLLAQSESGITVTGRDSLLQVSSLTFESASTLRVSQGGRVETAGDFITRDNAGVTLDQSIVETAGLSIRGDHFTVGNGSSLKTGQASVSSILTVEGPGFDTGSGLASGFQATNRILISSSLEGKTADVRFSGGARVVTADGDERFVPEAGPSGIKLIGSWASASLIGANKTQNRLARVVVAGEGTRWEHAGSLYVRGQTDIALKAGATLTVSDGIYIGAEDGLDTWTATTTRHTLLVERDATLKAAWIVFGSGNADVTLQGTLETGSLFKTRTSMQDLQGGPALGERKIRFDGATFRVTAEGWRMGDGTASGAHRDDVLAGVLSVSSWSNGFRHGELILDAGGLVVDTSEAGATGRDVSISATFAGEGRLIKIGSGTLRLANANLYYTTEHHTFTGGIEVREGTLGLSDSVMDPATVITLAKGTTLELDFDGMMTIAALVVDGYTYTSGIWDKNNLGDYLTGDGRLLISAIPEPTTWTALVGAILLVAVCSLRRHRLE
ncbi:hypothetical protein OpiT1DRAFT_04460 [Opitutaceae bacterium TAV1]|nr:hypothetical protein OpiT1DRAFT_04460 [Opitutaceae bacterium TAV1]